MQKSNHALGLQENFAIKAGSVALSSERAAVPLRWGAWLMAKLRLLVALGKPRIMLLMSGLALAGAALSPDFLSAAFPDPRLGLPPTAWSLVRATGAALVVALLWLGTALIHTDSERIAPSQALRWGLGAQAVAFLLVLIEGSRHAMTLALLGAGLGNAYSLPAFRLRQSGPAAHLITGGGVVLALCGGMMSQTGVTEVGFLAALTLGLLAAAVSMIRDFGAPASDRPAGIRNLPALVGLRAAVYINMVLVTAAYLLALFALLHTTGMQETVIALFSLPMGANLHLLHRLLSDRSPAYARRAYGHTVIIFMFTTVLYVGAQALYV